MLYFSGWTENRATLGKGASGVSAGVSDIEKQLPFELLGADCDNGSEFLNYHMIRYFNKRSKPVSMARSRPYKKK